MKRLQLLFCILLTWLFASHSSAQTTFQDDRGWLEFQDEVNELIFQAYTFPEDSYEIRLMLTELLGYEGSQVFTDEEAEMLEEFEELMGFTPTHLPVLQLDLTLSRYFLDGTASVEYARFWLRLSDGKILHNLIGLRATSTKPVYDEQSFEDTFAKVSIHWFIMSRHERDWVELSHNSQRFDDGYFSSTSNYFYEPGVPSAHDRATDPGITLIEDVALGVWEGDGSPVELGTAGTVMQIGVGFAPFWGQLADGRDTYYALETVIASGGEEGKGQLGLALAAWVPGGDAIKGGSRLGNKGLDATKGMLKSTGPLEALSKANKDTLKQADEFFAKKKTLFDPHQPKKLGDEGEKAVGITGPKKKIYVNGRTRIPDSMTKTTLTEVKNTASQSFTKQLRDFLDYAKQNNLKFELFVRPGAGLSGPLTDAIAKGDIILREIPQ